MEVGMLRKIEGVFIKWLRMLHELRNPAAYAAKLCIARHGGKSARSAGGLLNGMQRG